MVTEAKAHRQRARDNSLMCISKETHQATYLL